MSQRKEPIGYLSHLGMLSAAGVVLTLGKALLWAMFGQHGAGAAVAAWCGIAVALGLWWERSHIRSLELRSKAKAARPSSQLVLSEITVDAIKVELALEKNRRKLVLSEIEKLTLRDGSGPHHEDSELGLAEKEKFRTRPKDRVDANRNTLPRAVNRPKYVPSLRIGCSPSIPRIGV